MCKNPIIYYLCKADYIWSPCTCACEIDKYLKSIIGDLVLIRDEIIEVTKTISTKTVPTISLSTNFKEEKVTYKT